MRRRTTNEQRAARIAEVERRVAAGRRLKDIAAELGVSFSSVVRDRSASRRAAGIPNMRTEPGRRTLDRREELLKLRAEGLTLKQIGARLGIRKSSVANDLKQAGCVRPQRALSDDEIAQIRRMTREGVTTNEIAKTMGLRHDVVRRRALETGYVTRRPTRPKFTEAEIEAVRQGMLAGEGTSSEIAVEIGRSREQVSFHIRRLRPTLPPASCVCGKPLFHLHGCSARSGRRQASGRPIVTRSKAAEVRKLLSGGESAEAISALTGLSLGQIGYVGRDLSDADRERRALRRRRTGPVARGRAELRLSAAEGGGDPLYRRIWSSIPAAFAAQVDRHLCKDIAQEIYLAVLEGKIASDEIEMYAWTIGSAQRRKFADGFRQMSLDEEIGPDSDRSLGDLIGDDYAERLVDDLPIGDLR